MRPVTWAMLVVFIGCVVEFSSEGTAQEIDLHGPARPGCDVQWSQSHRPASEYQSYIESCIRNAQPLKPAQAPSAALPDLRVEIPPGLGAGEPVMMFQGGGDNNNGSRNKPLSIALFKAGNTPIGPRIHYVGLVELEGNVYFNSQGIILRGVEGFRRIQLLENKKQWIEISDSKLVAGKAVITTKNGKHYAIFDLGMVTATGYKLGIPKPIEAGSSPAGRIEEATEAAKRPR